MSDRKRIRNNYPGRCATCGRRVDAGKGWLMQKRLSARIRAASATRPIKVPLVLFCGTCAPTPKGETNVD